MSLLLEIRILSYWRAGTGAGQAGSLDAVCLRDDLGLPILPGKHLRGLLRDGLTRAIELGWVTDVTVEDMFGSRTVTGEENTAQDTTPGQVRVGSARLPARDRRAIGARPDLAPHLFTAKKSTAIQPETGTARPMSLRMEELALPVTLEAEISSLGSMNSCWKSALSNATPLIRAIGAGRTRGLGRCILSVSQTQDESQPDA